MSQLNDDSLDDKNGGEKSHILPMAPTQESILTKNGDKSLVHLDGTTLEGGGQLVRLALTLSALTCIPVHISHIRGKRGNRTTRSGGGGGLKSSHLLAVNFLAHACCARATGASVGSKELIFEPGRDGKATKAKAKGQYGIPGDMYISGHFLRMETPGSVWLVLQALLPYLVFCRMDPAQEGYLDEGDYDEEDVLQEVTIEGGTNVSKSMSAEYVQQVLVPLLVGKVGLPRIEVEVRKRGWAHGSRIEIGEVKVKVMPLRTGHVLPAFRMVDRGHVTKVAISVLASPDWARELIRGKAVATVMAHFPATQVETVVDEDSGDDKRLYLLLVAHTAHGYRLGRDWLYDGKTKAIQSKAQVDALGEKMVKKVTADLEKELEHGGCVDEFMADQLVVFQVLSAGTSVVEAGKGRGEGSLHTQTCRWVAEEMMGKRTQFGADGGCKGVGFTIGQAFDQRSTPHHGAAVT